MARNEIQVDATPEDAYAVLADPELYAYWVVGSKDVRDADDGFPAVGTRFHHTLGVGPFEVRDHSTVMAAERPNRFVLRVKGRPLGTATVEMTMVPHEGGTLVEMREDPADLLSRAVHNPLADLLLRARNVETLRRFKKLAEAHASGGTAAARAVASREG